MGNFQFRVLSRKHKKWFIIHQITIITLIGVMILIGVKVTNPSLTDPSDKINLSMGAMLGLLVFALSFINRIKQWLKIKFVLFLVIWIFLLSFSMIIETLQWTIGLALIPMAIDDIILLPMWRRVWYNQYEQ